MPVGPEHDAAVMKAIKNYVNASLANYTKVIASGAPAAEIAAAGEQARQAAQLGQQAGVPTVSQPVAQAVQSLENKIAAITAWQNLAKITPNTNASQKAYNNKAIALLNAANINNLLKNNNGSQVFQKISNNRKNPLINKLQNKAGARISRNIQQAQNEAALKAYLNSNLHQKRLSILNNNNTDPFRITKATVTTNINTKRKSFPPP